MEREHIIKALECCINHEGDNCHICPYHYTLNGFNHNCKEDMCEDALALIKALAEESQKWQEAYDCADSACRELSSKCDELTEENEKLNERLGREARCQYDLCGQIVNLSDEVKYIKAEIVQKMQERLNDTKFRMCGGGECYIYAENVDVIAKELLEENNV